MHLSAYLAICSSFLILSGCANHAQVNQTYEKALIEKHCGEKFFEDNLNKIKNNNDVIYTGLNTGLLAKNCGKFETSNTLFDAAEESYKYDVDLENVGKKGAKLVATTLINDTIVDYEGSLYERIMVNSYKALNFMNLGNFKDARVEFNRALLRQEKAKDYFAKQIERDKKELEEQSKEAKKDENFDKNFKEGKKVIEAEYSHLFAEFDTAKRFTNPYATYLASVFFFMDQDYKRARDLFREVAIINPKDKEIQKESKIFNNFAKSTKAKGKYIFVVYENGFGAVKEEFSLTLPVWLVEGSNVVATSIALQTLKKRDASYPYLEANGTKTAQVVDLDNIIATEFKINMPSMITKALVQTALKTTLNAAVANNDKTGGFLSLGTSTLTALTTQADVRSWRGLPKSVSVAMIENKGAISIKNPEGAEIHKADLDKNKNVLVFVRSFSPLLPTHIEIIEN